MRTIKILLLFFTFALISCRSKPEKEELYELTYVVFYQNSISDTVIVNVPGKATVFSSEGSNWIHIDGSWISIAQTTAPIKILKQTKLK